MFGDLAALTCALCFALCSMAFASAGRVVGAALVNQTRILIAVVALGGAHLAVVGGLWPVGLSGEQQVLLVGSGIIGLAVGDLFYFHSLTVLGPRLGTLLMATFPLFAVLADGWLRGVWPAAGAVPAMLGIIAGVVLVLTRGRGAAVAVWSPQTTPAGHTWAIVAGLLGALGQGLGLVLSKMADTTAGGAPLHSVSMTLVRMVAGLGGVLVLLALRGATRRSPARRRPMTGSAFLWILVGALLGPILGVWLSMYAVQQAAGTGRAAVLIALTPVLMIPISLVVYRERPGLLSWAGTLLAFAGTAGLMLGSSV